VFFKEFCDESTIYRDIRTADAGRLVSVRSYFDEVWSQNREYLESELPRRAAIELQPVFWEVRLTEILIDSGLPLVPQSQRKAKTGKPDFKLDRSPVVWIEATAVSGGIGADAVQEGPPLEAVEVPDDQIVLRILGGLSTKKAIRDEYMEKGVIHESEPFVVAVNAGEVPMASLELRVPRILRAVFPIGHLSIDIDRETGQAGSEAYSYRPEVEKASGTPVSTRAFQDETFGGISAVLYSTATPYAMSKCPSDDIVAVHNPLATAPLEVGFLPCRQEWVTDGDVIRSVTGYALKWIERPGKTSRDPLLGPRKRCRSSTTSSEIS
jgi:hypothetical protein